MGVCKFVCVSVRRLQVAVLEITTPNFGFSTASTLGRSIFFGFGKKLKKRKKISKNPLKAGFFFKKAVVCNGFSISLAFWKPLVTRQKKFFLQKF